MDVTYVIAGRITREYVFHQWVDRCWMRLEAAPCTPVVALLPWATDIGLLARVGEDYPRAWLKSVQARDIDVKGVKILPQSVDLREFIAYEEDFETHARIRRVAVCATQAAFPQGTCWVTRRPALTRKTHDVRISLPQKSRRSRRTIGTPAPCMFVRWTLCPSTS